MAICNLITNMVATPNFQAGIYIIALSFDNNASVGDDDKFYLDRWEVINGSEGMLEDILVKQIVPYYMNENIWMDEALIYMAESVRLQTDTTNGTVTEEGEVNYNRRDITEEIKNGITNIIDTDIRSDALYIYKISYLHNGSWCSTEVVMSKYSIDINSYGSGEDLSQPGDISSLIVNDTNIGLANTATDISLRGLRPYHITRVNFRFRGTIESCKLNQFLKECGKHLNLLNNISRACATKLEEALDSIYNIKEEEFSKWL